MKVKKLRKLLKAADPNATVVLSIDPRPLSDILVYKLREIGHAEMTPELLREHGDVNRMGGGKPCFVLWPA